MDALSTILEALAPAPGRRLLDIGCGSGALARTLSGRGAAVTGVAPNPAATFLEASAEALPFPDGHFAGAVMLNALHHVPDPAAALHEAARVVARDGRVVVVEPLAHGTYFDALRPIEDETAVRAAAQRAIAAAMAAGTLRCTRNVTFDRAEAFADAEAFLARATAVDPARLETIAARRLAILDIFARAAERDASGRFILRQPLRAHVLAVP